MSLETDIEAPVTDAVGPLAASRRRISWKPVLGYAVLPVSTTILLVLAGYFAWQVRSAGQATAAATQSVQAATESTVAMLAYQPDTAEQGLTAAADRTTGSFRDEYTALITDIVIPGAQEKRISSAAEVVAAASISADPDHAVVLVYVNQTTTIGNDPPTDTTSSVRVALDRIDSRWLVSQFEPI